MLVLSVAALSLLVVASATRSGSGGSFGLDVSLATAPHISDAEWTCMRSRGNYAFAVVEAFNGGYGRTDALAEVLRRSQRAGFSVDVYSFMCPRCGNSAKSASDLAAYLLRNASFSGRLWLDVEQCNGCWESDLTANCNFVKSLASAYQRAGIRVGVYTSVGEWPSTVGSGCSLSSLPLWYAHYDGVPSFEDFRPFAGWTKPTAKQFADHADNSCGVSIDRNWKP